MGDGCWESMQVCVYYKNLLPTLKPLLQTQTNSMWSKPLWECNMKDSSTRAQGRHWVVLHSAVHIFYFKKPNTTEPRADLQEAVWTAEVRSSPRAACHFCAGDSQAASQTAALRTRTECWPLCLPLVYWELCVSEGIQRLFKKDPYSRPHFHIQGLDSIAALSLAPPSAWTSRASTLASRRWSGEGEHIL